MASLQDAMQSPQFPFQSDTLDRLRAQNTLYSLMGVSLLNGTIRILFKTLARVFLVSALKGKPRPLVCSSKLNKISVLTDTH